MKTLLALAFCSLLAAPAFAGGVVLINQSNALAGSVTPGDAPGFPVTISVAGSYQLSSNLVVPDASTTAIQVTADNVTIDLNGFSIVGPVACVQGLLVASCNSSSGIGIESESLSNTNLSISNGTITGMGGAGIYILGEAHIDHVQTNNCGGGGILVGGPAGTTIISSSVAYGNGGTAGIYTLGAVIGSAASRNQHDGIDAGSVITNSTAISNGGAGINATQGGTVVNGNTVGFNSGAGITALCASSIIGNVAYANNGNIVTSGSGCLLLNNVTQ
jgi:hypothetical protein